VLPAQVTSTITIEDDMNKYEQVHIIKNVSTGFACLLSDGAWVQISFVLFLILQLKNNIYKQSISTPASLFLGALLL
jgi:hypothetical protein